MLQRISSLAVAGALVLLGAVGLGTEPASAAGTGTIAGTVYGHAGPLLADATVTVYQPAGRVDALPSRWRPLVTTTTGSDGSFSQAVAPGTYRLRVQPKDLDTDSYGYWVTDASITPWVAFAGNVTVTADATATVAVHMTVPAAITGRVTDHGKGLSGMEVRAVLAGGPDLNQYSDISSPDYPSTLTVGKRGEYRLRGLPTAAPDPDPATPQNEALYYGPEFIDPTGQHSPYLWWFTYYGGASNVPAVDVTAEPLAVRDVKLMRSGVQHIHVTDAGTGAPVPGLEIISGTAYQYPHVATDANGDAYLGGLTGEPTTVGVWDPLALTKTPADTYRTTFYGDEPTWATAATFTVRSGKTITVGIHVRRGSGLITLVALRDGAPAVGIGVGVTAYAATGLPPDPGADDYSLANGTTLSSSDGGFQISGLWPGDYQVWVSPPETGIRTFDTGVAAGQTVDLGTVDVTP